MCELMTTMAALIFTSLYFAGNGSKAVFTTMLMFWGASLMWAGDCAAEFMAGKPLFDFSREDAILGVIILAAGLLVYAVLAVRERRPPRRA